VKAADLLPGKKVIVLEAAKKPGGATNFGHGAAISDSTWQRNAGATPKEPQDLSGQFFDFLVSKDEEDAKKHFKFLPGKGPDAPKMNIDMPRRVDKYKNLDDASIGPGWWGTYIVDKMMECCKKMSIPVLTETRAKKLIKDPSGKVTAVLADTGDGELQVNFKACYIAAGGFGANLRKCKEVWPRVFIEQMHNLNPPTLTGDWISFAEEIGAAIDLKNARPNVQGPIHHPYSYTVTNMARSSVMQLQVNLDGERVAEPGGRFGIEVADPLVYSIADRDVLEKAGETVPAIIPEELENELAKDHWREAVAEEIAVDEKWGYGQHITKADTLVDLAMKIKIDPLVFLATVEKYNQEVKDGGASGKSPSGFFQGSLPPMPIQSGPFYAIFGQRFRQCTHGGIVISENSEVLDVQGNAMPGLYAGGDCTTLYVANSGPRPSAQEDNPLGGGPSIFGNYIATPGGGIRGIPKGISAAASIAKYLGNG
jgi:hypothetical protein